jgi:hypothetical protein
MFSGDEHLAGTSPSQGTELCAVAEYMYSMEWLLSLTGKARYADKLETVAFNALPATFSPDMWAHQYDQQCNQPICTYSEDNVYTNNGPDANLFGLDPNFGCCTANMHQAWPKFASSLWMKRSDGLVAFSYAPCETSTSIQGVPVEVSVQSDYPFRETVRILVSSVEQSRMKLRLRQPMWCRALSIRCDDPSYRREREGHFYVVEADWHNGIELHIELPMSARWDSRHNDSVSLVRGPLVYALAVDDEWVRSRPDKPYNEPPHGEWEVHPKSPWHYALEHRATEDLVFADHEIGDVPFSPEGAPVTAATRARLLPGWGMEHNTAAPPPPSPVERESMADEESVVRLIPYGCTNLRITEFPWYPGDLSPATPDTPATAAGD